MDKSQTHVYLVHITGEHPRTCGSFPEELGGGGHSRTSSYASQQSKVSGEPQLTQNTSLIHHGKEMP